MMQVSRLFQTPFEQRDPHPCMQPPKVFPLYMAPAKPAAVLLPFFFAPVTYHSKTAPLHHSWYKPPPEFLLPLYPDVSSEVTGGPSVYHSRDFDTGNSDPLGNLPDQLFQSLPSVPAIQTIHPNNQIRSSGNCPCTSHTVQHGSSHHEFQCGLLNYHMRIDIYE